MDPANNSIPPVENTTEVPVSPPISPVPDKNPLPPKSSNQWLNIFSGLISLVAIGLTVFVFRDSLFKLIGKSPAPESETASSSASISSFLISKRLIDPKDISVRTVQVTPQVSPYQLPLDTGGISNYKDLAGKLKISSKAKSLLEKNGFTSFSTPGELIASPQEFDEYYNTLTQKDLPVFVTTDSLLHYYHVFFDTALMRLEKDIFYDDIWQISQGFLTDQLAVFEQSADLLVKEAAKRNIAYISVAMELLRPKSDQTVTTENVSEMVNCDAPDELCERPYKEALENGTFAFFSQTEAEKYSFKIPEIVKDTVAAELKLISEKPGWKCSPIYLYEEDYSQYTPRGHYTKSEKLKNYFTALMWYGRMTNLVQGSPKMESGVCNLPPGWVGTDLEGFVANDDAEIQTVSALLLANKFSADSLIQQKWSRIYAITAYFVGFSDDLGPVEYASVLDSQFKDQEKITPEDISKNITGLKTAIKSDLPKPKIYGGLGNAQMTVVFPPPLNPEQINTLKKQAATLLANTQGFRLLGQREVVDSTIFSNIVTPYSGEYTGDPAKLPFTHVVSTMGRQVRGFPRGLDIMAIFGSNRAKEIITELGDADYSEYERVFTEQKQKIDSLPEDEWFTNLYWNWLYVLKSLHTEFGDGYPTFMQSTAWQDKELVTALASWTELRHDTILYVKQSYSMAEMGGGGPEPPIVGYVEPVPDFYLRLSNLSKMTHTGLTRLLTKEELERVNITWALETFNTLLDRLLEISKSELENKALTDDDYSLIKHFGTRLKSINTTLIGAKPDDEVDPDMFKTTLVADVHTEGNSKQVLEEGVGLIKTMIVAYRVPDGRILVGIGPVFSYYEFKQPMENRLTDEAWRQLLITNPPAEPEWVKSFSE